MNAMHTKSAFLFERIRRVLREGRYLPGQHIEPLALAREFKTSVTPVRYALHQLAGADLIEIHPRGGFHVPMLFESALEGRYAWLERLLLDAIDRGSAAHPAAELPAVPEPTAIPDAAWALFNAIADATDYEELCTALKRANDQLAPVRHAKHALLDDAHDELSALYRHWAARDVSSLKAGIRAYHERRIAMVPRIVSHLSQKRASVH
ncbi:GntR family transcriptional regulator [Luteimonas sp. RC10]|uniref:GntR family transcriptional regulator n=1 Tax=Luteimonas sp. RC10 TaxID=2587035 RepID=UPI00160FAA7E|nr:GntR family transcriptional regulator [Luteimonas sp. RC10]MBB3344748.1 hypothetical protein [Luteimonas sp. RC10]